MDNKPVTNIYFTIISLLILGIVPWYADITLVLDVAGLAMRSLLFLGW
jgi:hypothetical protein